MLLPSFVFLAIISIAYCNKSDNCASYETCVKDIKKTNETFTTIMIDYWIKRLDLDAAITNKLKTSVGYLNEDISNGSKSCSKHLLPVNNIAEYSANVQNACFSESPTFVNPKEVEDYFRGRYTGSMQKLCDVYVKHLNSNCQYLARGIDSVGTCDVEKVFDDLYRKPWEICVKESL